MRDVDRSMILKVRDMIAGVVHSIPCATITFGTKVPSSIIVLSGNVGIFWWFINPVGRFTKPVQLIAILLGIIALSMLLMLV